MGWEKEDPEEYQKWLESDEYKQWLDDQKNNRHSAIIPPGGPPMNREEREIHLAMVGTPIRDEYGRVLTWAGPIGSIPDTSTETATAQESSPNVDGTVNDNDDENSETKIRNKAIDE